MTSEPRAVAFVGVAGGVGTTRLVVETAAVLARAGRDVAILDAAFATQGLAQYVPGRVDVDATRLVTDDGVAPSDAFVDLEVDVASDAEPAGRVAACPARASFAGLAGAMTTDAAERFDAVVAETASAFDAVLVDVPPIAANQHVAAVTAADRLVLVAPASDRGADALPRAQDRVRDLDAGAPEDVVVANHARGAHDGHGDRADNGNHGDYGNHADHGDHDWLASVDVAIPESDAVRVADAPVCDSGSGAFPASVRDLAETAFDVELDVDLESRSVAERFLNR